MNIWRIPISPKTFQASGPAEQLTFGTANQTYVHTVPIPGGAVRMAYPLSAIQETSRAIRSTLIRGSLLFISNDYELELTRQKTGLGPEELLNLTAAVVTTRGEQGSVLLHRENGLHRVEIPAVKPEKVADPTGAGDAYRAGLLKGLLTSRGALLHACRMGAAAAAYAVEVYGTQTYRYTPETFSERFADAFGYPAF